MRRNLEDGCKATVTCEQLEDEEEALKKQPGHQ